MKLFVLRHGQAEPSLINDDVRQLTAKGRLVTRRVIEMRREALSNISQLWVSPLIRAQQTAEIVASYVPGLSLQTTSLLIPEAKPGQVIDWLQSFSANESILLVSHLPLVGKLLDQLCGQVEGYHPMATSSLAALELEPVAAGLARLLWLDHVN